MVSQDVFVKSSIETKSENRVNIDISILERKWGIWVQFTTILIIFLDVELRFVRTHMLILCEKPVKSYSCHHLIYIDGSKK